MTMEGNTDRLAVLIAERLKSVDTQSWGCPEGTTTRHLIADDLLPSETAARIAAAFPRNARWNQRDTFRERKKTFAKLDTVDPLIGEITDAFHRPNVLAAVQALTQIAGLEADPSLYAGGISMMGRGDFLNPHIDNSHDGARKRYRRLNLLYYISPGWRLENGGNFELWDDRVRTPKVIQSAFNRLVIMETNRHSWHSVEPVIVEAPRCCISNYYFSQGSPEGRDYYHVTSFLGRPGEHLRRIGGRIDNFLRQTVSRVTGLSRGKRLARY
jgi:Rps23 Pro-64 3,4-dihydroxylase Tpa1-like proline 4-hydroxylase